MNLTQNINKKEWTTGDKMFTFSFDISFENDENKPFVIASILCNPLKFSKYQNDRKPQIVEFEENTSFDLVFSEVYRLKGDFELRKFSFDENYGNAGIWADFVYTSTEITKCKHFEGIIASFEASDFSPSSGNRHCELEQKNELPFSGHDCLPEPLDSLCEDVNNKILGVSAQSDLFPYMYMRAWPRISVSELNTSFIQYNYTEIKINPALNWFYTKLVDLKKSGKSDIRGQMETLAVEFIESKAPYKDQFINDINVLNGLIKRFASINVSLCNQADINTDEIISKTCDMFSLELEEVKKYLQSPEYLAEKDSVWQSYFALVITTGYKTELLEIFVLTLRAASLLERVFGDNNGEKLTMVDVNSLLNAVILLPSEVFPLPSNKPSTVQDGNTPAAPKPELAKETEWVKPYAVGELLMTRQQLIGYEPGEIAYIENVMKGERSEVKRRRLNRVGETFQNNEEQIKTRKDEIGSGASNLLKETLKTIADNLVTTNYDNFNATYGPPSTAKLSGGWSVETKPDPQIPSKDDMYRFAKEVLNKTSGRVASTVNRLRNFTAIDETEETATCVIDNTNGSHNIRGVYRWLEKVYSAHVVNYGSRLMIEFLIEDPAFSYINAEFESTGVELAKSVHPFHLGIESYENIDTENAAKLAAVYNVDEIEHPPAGKKIVSASMQNACEKQVVVPLGYKASKAVVLCMFPKGTGDYRVEGIVGKNPFSFESSGKQSDSVTFEMNDEDSTVPVIVMGNAIPSSPPAAPSNFIVTVEVECAPTEGLINEWKQSVYKSLTIGYENQKILYNNNVGHINEGDIMRSPSMNRGAERGELKKRCVNLMVGKCLRNAPNNDKDGLSGFDVNAPHYAGFFEQSFEWNEMTYSFHVNLKDQAEDAKLKSLRQNICADNDPLFVNFLQADYARVLVPVSMPNAMPVLYYLSTGEVWRAGRSITPAHINHVNVVDDIIKSEAGRQYIEKESPAWKVTIPTSMYVLQDSPELPSFSVGVE